MYTYHGYHIYRQWNLQWRIVDWRTCKEVYSDVRTLEVAKFMIDELNESNGVKRGKTTR